MKQVNRGSIFTIIILILAILIGVVTHQNKQLGGMDQIVINAENFDIVDDNLLAVFVEGERVNYACTCLNGNPGCSCGFPTKDSGYVFQRLKCTHGGVANWDDTNWELKITNISQETACVIFFDLP